MLANLWHLFLVYPEAVLALAFAAAVVLFGGGMKPRGRL
jgi:hypothetical protein